jgi:hypothetical protein
MGSHVNWTASEPVPGLGDHTDSEPALAAIGYVASNLPGNNYVKVNAIQFSTLPSRGGHRHA